MAFGRVYLKRSRRLGWLLTTTASLVAGAVPALAQQQPAVDRATTTAAATYSFNIPSKSLVAAIADVGAMSGWRIAYTFTLPTNARSKALSGSMTPPEAVKRLLAGSGITLRIASAQSIVLIDPQKTASGNGSAEPGATALQTITVQGEGDGTQGYVATRSMAGTKTDTPLISTPQSISVVTRKQIDDQSAQSVSQALRYTPGVVAEYLGQSNSYYETFYSRGFASDSYLDGLRIQSSSFNVTAREPYLLDRIESIQGPASVLYGQAAPGGIFNLVDKMPTETPLHEVYTRFDNYGRTEGGFDFSGPATADKTWLYRLTGMGFNTGTQIDHIDQQRIAIAPALTWQPDSDTSLTILGNYQNDPKAGAYNFVTAQGTVLPNSYKIPRSLDTGDPGFDKAEREETSVGYQFKHSFSDAFEIRQNLRYSHNTSSLQAVAPYGVSADGKSLLRSSYRNAGTLDGMTIDNQAITRFQTGPLDHELLFGLDYQHFKFDYRYYGSGKAPSLDIANPVYNQSIGWPTFLLGSSSRTASDQAGLYAQDQVKVGNLSVLFGLRQDWLSSDSLAYKTSVTTRTDDSALSGRIGTIYNFDNGLAPYVSYSTSFQPTSGVAGDGTPFKPTEGEQYEVGLKYQPPGSTSLFTASLFNLTKTNVVVTDPVTYIATQTGKVRSRGIELESRTNVTDQLSLIASYTYNDVRNVEASSDILDKAPVAIPRNMASLWASYDLSPSVLNGVTIGAGVRYVGETYGDSTNTFKVPAATLVDASLQYDFAAAKPSLDGLTATLTATNLFNRNYIASCVTAASCNYGVGRTVIGTLKYRW